MTSEITLRAQALVAQRLPQARGLGEALAQLIDEPEEFVAMLREGLAQLADAAYAAEQERVAPGSGAVFGVRGPLLSAVWRRLRQALREGTAASALWLAERLADEDEREFVLFSHVCLERSLPDDPERSWQLMRRLARRAPEWISVDSLADLYAQGILNERFRWAELEQLVYSTDTWERRLVGSTVARLPYRLKALQRPRLSTSPGLTLIKSLLGDAQPDVQKALSWALRSWTEVDLRAVRELLRAEADIAGRTNDGHRAWVLRDALSAPRIEPGFAAEVRTRLAGIRRDADRPATSAAAAVAGGFVGLERLADKALSQQGVRQGRAAPLSAARGTARDG